LKPRRNFAKIEYFTGFVICHWAATLNTTRIPMSIVTTTLAGGASFNQTIAKIDAWNNHNAIPNHEEGPERLMT
jgi:hypothetical protein